MPEDADYYLEYAARVEATSPALAELLRKRASEGSRMRAGTAGVSPSPGTATVRQPSAPPFAYRAPVIPSPDRATGPMGRERDIQSELWGFQDKLGEVEQGLVDYYMMQERMAPDAARERAQEDIKQKVMSRRFNVEGRPEYGGMEGWLPMTRESRIITRRIQDPTTGEIKETDLYYDPDTQELREPTASEYAIEAFAKQELMGPEKIGKLMSQLRQQVSDITRQLNYDVGSPEEQEAFDEKYREVVAETFDDWFMYTKPGTAKTLETFTGAALRSWPAITSTIVNTALMGYAPLFWEQDENGQPVDPDSWAYRAHEALVEAGQSAGMSEEQARDALQGGVSPPVAFNLYNPLGAKFFDQVDEAATGMLGETAGGAASTLVKFALSPPEISVPIPFQPVKRAQATSIDPYGNRVASATGNFIIDVAQNLRRGRSMGDELMSISALAEDRADDFYRAREGYKESAAAGKNTIYEHVGTTAPYWYGVGMEMVYGIGPFASLAKLARGGEKALNAAAKAAGAESIPGVSKAAFVVAHPVEAAARAKTLRVIGDLFEGRSVHRDPLDILTEANNARRVAGEYGSREILTPYNMLAYLYAKGAQATGEGLQGTVQGSQSGAYVLANAGMPNLPNGALSPGQAGKLRDSIYRWIASAYLPAVDTILSSSQKEAEKFKRIRSLLKEAGANQKVFPTLKNPNNLSLEDWVKTLFPDNVSSVKGALPVQPGKHVMVRVHKLGADIVTASRQDDWGQLTGELGRIVQRRIGNNKVGPEFIRTQPARVFEATRAAGGRAIEATIENIVPDNYVFVTRTLLAPRHLLTKDVYKQVAREMSDIRDAFVTKTGSAVVDGRKVNDVTVRDAMITDVSIKIKETFGAANIRRSPALSSILKNIQEKKAITESEKAYLLDGFETEAFRDALQLERSAGVRDPYSAARTAFGGEQAELAMVEGVNVGLSGAPEARVARRQVDAFTRRELPMVISEGGGRQIMSAVRKALRAVGAKVEEPPPIDYEKMSHLPVQRMIEELKNRVGSISDNFQRELRDAVIDARANVPPVSPEVAFDRVLAKRLSKAQEQAVRDLRAEATRLMNVVGLSRADAYYRVAYTQATDVGGIAVGPLSGQGIDWEVLAHQQARAGVKENAWRDVLSLYFDKADFEDISSAVEDLMLSPGATRAGSMEADDYLDLTVYNVREVISDLRKRHKGLEDAGAGVNFLGIPTSLNQDAIAQVLTAWAVAQDRSRITAQLLDTLRARHPEVWVDLIPSAYSSRPHLAKLETMLSLKNRTTLFDTLIESVDPAWQGLYKHTVKTEGLLTPGSVTRKGLVSFISGGEGTLSREFDKISERMYSSLTPAARVDLVNKVLKEILNEGTVDLSFDRLLSKDVGFMEPFQKHATVQGLRAFFRGMDTAADPADDILVRSYFEAIGKAVRAGKTPEEAMESLASELQVKLTRNAFYTVIAPAVREVLSNARAMGFTPGKGPQSLNNVVHEVASINPYQPSILLVGDDYRKALEKLQGAARDGRLIENLEMLRQRDRLRRGRKGERAERGDSRWEFAKHFLLDVAYSTRTLAASGLLAGGFYARGPWAIPVPAPNLRYIGMNLITAPLIALTTVGAAGALKAARGVGWGEQARDVARQVSSLVGHKLVDAVSPRAADDVVFTTATGRKWTWAELQDAMDRNNIMITRGSVEFQESWMRDVLRDARLTSEGMPAGKFRHFLRSVDPLRTNIFQYMANATDRAFRQNMFASALKEGLTEQQAAQLGRAVVLDYGRLPTGLRSTLNRVLLFIAFRSSMAVELIEALARDAGTFNRQLLLMRDSQQASTQYMLAPDYAKARLVFDPTEYIFDGSAGAVNYGPTHPTVDSYFDLLKMGQWAYTIFDDEVPTGQLFANAIAEENLHPAVTAAIESWVTSSMRETDKGWKVPDVWAAWALHNGPDSTWPWLKDRYNLRAVMRKADRTPGRPTMRGSTEDAYAEWYFTDVGDMRKFKRDLMFATYMGFRRTTEDWTKSAMSFYDSDYIDEKRRGNVPAFAFMSGLLTPIGAKSPEEIMSKALFEQKRAANELQPKLERW